jgi:hypothetical protein
VPSGGRWATADAVPSDVATGAKRAQVVRLVTPAEDDRRDVIDLGRAPPAEDAAMLVAAEHLEAERSPTPRRSSAARMNLARLTVRATRDRADDRRSWHPETVDRRRRSAILSGGVATRLPILSGGERVRRSGARVEVCSPSLSPAETNRAFVPAQRDDDACGSTTANRGVAWTACPANLEGVRPRRDLEPIRQPVVAEREV